MHSLDEELAQTFQAVAEEADPNGGARVCESVIAATSLDHRRNSRRFAKLGAIAAVGIGAAAASTAMFLSIGHGNTANQPPAIAGSGSASDGSSADCVSALSFGSNTYVMLLGAHVDTVTPGPRLGTGTYDRCQDGKSGGYYPAVGNGLTEAPARRGVYEMPGVPERQAILVTDGQGRGHVYLNSEKPASGWDSDLQILFDRWSVDR